MPIRLICPAGHSWEAATESLAAGARVVCPLCGKGVQPPAPVSAVDQTLVPADSSNLDATLVRPGGVTEPAAVPPGGDAPVAAWHAVPGYEILGELGRGGMGVVYKARQTGLGRLVALKMILHAEHAGREERQRFLREAEAVAGLRHGNIVQIYQVGATEPEPGRDAVPFMALEFLDGGSLDRKIAGTPWPPRPAAELVETLSRAVHHAHAAGVIHRDLKPANVLLAADDTPKITDFGLAKRIGGDAGQTQSGAILGTPSYMAPEQAAGRTREVGPAADVYALGAILYDVLTGRPPFRAESAWDTIAQVIDKEPLAPSQLLLKVPRDLETICLKCLHKEPRRRYASARELADDLRRFLDGKPIAARPVGPLERGWRWCRRNPWVAGLAAAVVLSLTAGVALSTAFALEAHGNAREATAKAHLAEENARKADANAGQARAAAIFAGKQRDLALDAFNTLLLSVHQAGADTPALRQMKERLVDTAEKGLARLTGRNDPSLTPDLGLAEARNRLASSFMLLGRFTAARREYETALAALHALLAADPNALRGRLVLASTCAALAQVCAAARDRASARKYAEQALQASEPLPAEGAERLQFQRAKTAGYVVLAGVAREEKHWPQARAYARRLLELNRLLAGPGTDAAAQLQVAGSHATCGGVEADAGDFKAAREALQKAIALERGLVTQTGDDPDVRFALSVHLVALANVNRKLGDRTGAAAGFREALGVQRQLLSLLPEVVLTQAAVADTCAHLGRLLWETGDRGAARQHLVEAATRVRKLSQADPGNPVYRRELLELQTNLGDISLAWEGILGARNHYRQALALAETLAKAEPASAELRGQVFAAHVRLADASRRLGQHADAGRHVRAARDLLPRLPSDLSPEGVALRVALAQLPTGAEQPADRLVVNSIGMELVPIRSGTFLMGSPEEARATAAFFNRKLKSESPATFVPEHPRHEVTLSRPFHLGATEVTRGQFRAFVTATGYRTDAEKDGRGFGGFNPTRREGQVNEHGDWRLAGDPAATDDHPVAGVSWNDAVAFCAWLSRKEKVKYRLPTEAEWEYACRAGTRTRFWTGDEPATLLRGANVPDASYKEGWGGRLLFEWLEENDGYAGAAPVGSFAANPWGLYDMHGNVWEWCQDGFDPKFYKAGAVDPAGPEDRPTRAMRGGCFM